MAAHFQTTFPYTNHNTVDPKELQAKIDQLTSENSELKLRVDSAEAGLKEALDTNAELLKTVEELELQVSAIPADKAVEAKVVKPTLPDQPFSVGGKKYKFTMAAFQFEGDKITAAQAIENKELLAKLVEIGFGGIEQVV
jgi:hypothetical protein